MDKNIPNISHYQEAYIELIAKKTADKVIERVENRLIGQIKENKNKNHELELRTIEVEKKVFNGYDLKIKHINWKITFLFAAYSAMIAVVIRMAFFQ